MSICWIFKLFFQPSRCQCQKKLFLHYWWWGKIA